MSYISAKGDIMGDVIVSIILIVIIVGAIYYIAKEKKKGNKCIGCSFAGTCTRADCKENKDIARKQNNSNEM